MGFHDAKGIWRSDGEGFYDAKGNWVSPGGAFYDSRGYLRSPGDGFYDAKGNWVSPGDAFYDGAGELHTWGGAVVTNSSFSGLIVTGLFLLFVPVFVLWLLMAAAIEWLAAHLYLVVVCYALLDAALCILIVRKKKRRGIRAALSFFGNYFSILAFLYNLLLYAAPYVLLRSAAAGSLLEATFALLIGAAVLIVLQFLNNYHENAVLEFLSGIAFFAAVLLILRHCAHEVRDLEAFAALYHVRATPLLRFLFGAALP